MLFLFFLQVSLLPHTDISRWRDLIFFFTIKICGQPVSLAVPGRLEKGCGGEWWVNEEKPKYEPHLPVLTSFYSPPSGLSTLFLFVCCFFWRLGLIVGQADLELSPLASGSQVLWLQARTPMSSLGSNRPHSRSILGWAPDPGRARPVLVTQELED